MTVETCAQITLTKEQLAMVSEAIAVASDDRRSLSQKLILLEDVLAEVGFTRMQTTPLDCASSRDTNPLT